MKNWAEGLWASMKKWLGQYQQDIKSMLIWKLLIGIVIGLSLFDGYLRWHYHGNAIDIRAPVMGVIGLAMLLGVVVMATAAKKEKHIDQIVRIIFALGAIAVWIGIFPW